MKHFLKNYNKEMILTILALAWPTMLEQLMQTAVQYIDTAMVGALGTKATAAVGATTTVNWLINSSVSALSIGFLAYIAKSLGAKNENRAREACAQAMLTTLVVGSVLTVVVLSLSSFIPVWMQVETSIVKTASIYFFILYIPMLPRCASTIFGTVLRASGDTKTPMKIGIVMNLINVVFNFLFIYPTRIISIGGISFTMYGANLGVIGAAIASAIAFAFGGIYITYVVYHHPTISFRGYSIKPNKEILLPCFKVAIPNMFQRFATSLGYVVFASMINSLGEMATAAHTIANTVESAFYIPGWGMQTAAATLSGNAYGAKDEKKMEDLANMFIPIEVLLMAFSGMSLYILAPSLMRIFSSSSEVVYLGSTVLRMVAVSEPFYGFSIIVEGLMQGVGKTKLPFVFNIMGMWLIRICGTYLCISFFHGGLVSAWGCMIAHNLFLCTLFAISYIKGLWNPLKT